MGWRHKVTYSRNPRIQVYKNLDFKNLLRQIFQFKHPPHKNLFRLKF